MVEIFIARLQQYGAWKNIFGAHDYNYRENSIFK